MQASRGGRKPSPRGQQHRLSNTRTARIEKRIRHARTRALILKTLNSPTRSPVGRKGSLCLWTCSSVYGAETELAHRRYLSEDLGFGAARIMID